MPLRLPVSPEEVPEPEWGPQQHRYREYRMRSGHLMVVEYPGPAWHPRMGATTPEFPVIGAVAWRWIAAGQPWRPLTEDEQKLAGLPRQQTEQEKIIDRGTRQFLRGGGSLFDAEPDD
jgi:hypothetical protein